MTLFPSCFLLPRFGKRRSSFPWRSAGLGSICSCTLLGFISLPAQTVPAPRPASSLAFGPDEASSPPAAGEASGSEDSLLPAPAGSLSGEAPKTTLDDDAALPNGSLPQNRSPLAPPDPVDLKEGAKSHSTSFLNDKPGKGEQLISTGQDHYDPTHPDYHKVSSFSDKNYTGNTSGLAEKQFDLTRDFFSSGEGKQVGRPTGLADENQEFPTKAYEIDASHRTNYQNKEFQGEMFLSKTFPTRENTSFNRMAKIDSNGSAQAEFRGDYFQNRGSKAYPVHDFEGKAFTGPQADEIEQELARVQNRLNNDKNLPVDHSLSIDDVRALLNNDDKSPQTDTAKVPLEERQKAAREDGRPDAPLSSDPGLKIGSLLRTLPSRR